MEVMEGNSAVPPGLVGKEDVIFGNMREIYEFHNRFVVLIIWIVLQTILYKKEQLINYLLLQHYYILSFILN